MTWLSFKRIGSRMVSRKSLFGRLSLSLGFLSTAIILVVSTLVFLFLSWRVGNQMQERAENTITFLAQALETPFWALDRESAAAVAKATSMDVNVGLLELRDSRGEEWFGYNTGNSLFIIREAEVSHDGQVIGFIRLGLEDSVRQKSLAGIGLVGGGIALLVILAQYCLAKRLLRYYFQTPFAALGSLVGAYARGDYTPADSGVNYTEFEPLVNAFLGMGQTIERQLNTLAESEERYRVIFDNSPVGIFRSTLEGELLEGNTALGEMFGYSSRDEFLAASGLRVEPVYADSSAREAYLRELLGAPGALSSEMEFVRKDGTHFEGVLTASIQQDAAGRPAFLNGVVEDISARKQAEKRLRQSEEKFSRLFRLSPDVIILLNMTDGRIIDVNEAFSRLTGFSYHEAVGKTALELGLYANPAMREFVRRRMQTTGQIDNVDFSLGCKDGRIISCVLSSQLLTVGDQVCVMAVLRDVTEFKRMQELMIELKTILLAEDNPNDVELTIEALKEHCLANNVVAVSDGVEALEYLRYEGNFKQRKKGMPAVLLLDIKMPRMDGIEVLQSIRSDDQLKMLPVVMLTSSREEPDLEKCYALGVNAYVVKPVNFKDFIDAVRHIGIFWALLNEQPIKE